MQISAQRKDTVGNNLSDIGNFKTNIIDINRLTKTVYYDKKLNSLGRYSNSKFIST